MLDKELSEHAVIRGKSQPIEKVADPKTFLDRLWNLGMKFQKEHFTLGDLNRFCKSERKRADAEILTFAVDLLSSVPKMTEDTDPLDFQIDFLNWHIANLKKLRIN